MKTLIILVFFLSSTFIFSQTKIEIDTLKIHYQIKNIVDITSLIPQISGEVNSGVKTKINADIKEYFMASIHQDSATYVKNLLADYELDNLTDYFKKIEQGEIFNADDEDESFEITSLSDNILNFTYSYQRLPKGGQYQFFFKSIIYDLSTGNKLDFEDFLSIDKENLISIFRREGYNISWSSNPDKPFEIVPINQNDEYVEKNLNDLFKENDRCIEFYFCKKGNDIHLMFKFLCAGPVLGDYGISLSKILPYIKHSEFKNEFKLWGKDINSIKGYDYLTIGNKIEFADYTIINSGSGFLLPKDNNLSKDEFGIAICHSPLSVFYLFLKYQTINNVKKATVLDILEINKTDLTTSTKLTEYCETNKGADSEILALVKDTNNNPEYYTEIIKAWKANRKTEKFEIIDRKMVKRCGNESYGI